ncbi:phosphoadenosine phosphosulfate reductase family protein [Sinorhizobium meliloti]|nr:phosphoadenosine phosphosulfate reductase family protein [Sinorhizobium meliloti]WQP26089.1 phosphoadenosine phosphosulfate reductase family protein [Sinorhizobium meliloti]
MVEISVASTVEVDHAVKQNAAVAIGVSGGKDSQAAALATFAYLDAKGHVGPRALIHSDLGSVEWNDSLPTCERLAEHLGAELIVVRRKAGDLMERWEARWASSKQRYAKLSTVTLVPCWSTPSLRFCTSELKTHIIRAELRRRFKGMQVVNVTGVRRQESAARAKGSIADRDGDGIINWRPISDWSVAEVFSYIAHRGLSAHMAYATFGMSRVSCRYCIMSNIDDLKAASAQEEARPLYRRMVQLEIDSSFAFQGSRWLGDIAPQLLSEEMREALALARHRAILRKDIEGQITKPMLYVKGWPTRMLTDDEAAILSSVRNKVTEIYGFESQCLTVDSIHQRYADLMSERDRRAA